MDQGSKLNGSKANLFGERPKASYVSSFLIQNFLGFLFGSIFLFFIGCTHVAPTVPNRIGILKFESHDEEGRQRAIQTANNWCRPGRAFITREGIRGDAYLSFRCTDKSVPNYSVSTDPEWSVNLQ